MIVAMIPMRMVQVAIDKKIDMVAMRHRLVTATRTVLVRLVVSRALMRGCAGRGIRRIDLEPMLDDLVTVLMMQVSIVEIIHVSGMLDGSMTATRAMPVVVFGVLVTHTRLR